MKIKSFSRLQRKLRKKFGNQVFTISGFFVGLLIVILIPLVIATPWTETFQVTSTDFASNDGFGRSVGVSGSYSIYGSPYSEVGAIRDAGAAYIMLDSAQQARLTASDAAATDYFGFAVALDGSTAAVGAYGADAGGKKDSGAVYIFTNSNGVWSQVAKLTASDAAVGDQFGVSVALQNGNLVVGAHQKNSQAGAAYVFTGSGASWTERKILTGGARESFGAAVAIDDSTIVVGAPAANSNIGAAYVFVGTDSVWLQQARLTPADGATGDAFGLHVAVSGDQALISSEYSVVDQKIDAGAIYLFTRALLAWSQTNKITASDVTAGMHFGSSVALDGEMAVVGAYRAGVSGATYNFFNAGSGFIQESKQLPTTGASTDALFGSAVAISKSSLKAAVGATNNSLGKSYIFSRLAIFTALFDISVFDNATFQ